MPFYEPNRCAADFHYAAPIPTRWMLGNRQPVNIFFSVSSLLETQPTYRVQFHFFPPGIDLLRTGYSCSMWKSPPESTRLPPQFRKTTKTLRPNTATCSMTTYFEVLTTSLATLTFIPFSSQTPKDLQSCFLGLL